jgi:hypothetical protein
MRYVRFVIGFILVVKGVKDCIALPAAISGLQIGASYSAGEATGLIVGTLALLAGGAILVMQGWRARRAVIVDAPAA